MMDEKCLGSFLLCPPECIHAGIHRKCHFTQFGVTIPKLYSVQRRINAVRFRELKTFPGPAVEIGHNHKSYYRI